MNLIYAIISCIFLPRLKFLGNLQGQSYPFIGISCLYGIWMLINGAYIIFDSLTIAVFTYILWMLTSILWTQKTYAFLEIIVWLSYLMMFIVARTIPLEYMIYIISINPVITALMQLYNIIVKKIKTAYKFPIFGNSNWNGSFLLLGFYSTMWLAFNISNLFFIISGIIGITIVLTKCRGAIIGLILSLSLFTYLTQNSILLGILCLVTLFAVIFGKRFLHTLKGQHLKDRWDIYKDAIKKIHPRWLIGRGMNYFRDTEYGRVHNDHLEIIGELGIIGYFLFLNIFYQANLSPLFLCTVLAIFIASMFFYPLREIPLAVPFWALIGSASNALQTQSFIILRLTGIFCLITVIIFTFTVYSKLLEIMSKKNV